ncbi:MAG: lysophospholipid acyltransferase family protein [Chthoniobacteraceae bacterium]
MRKARLIASFGSLLVRAIIFTMRIRIEDRAGVLGKPPEPRLIWLFWHNRLFLIPWLIQRKLSQRPGSALTSASKDGDYLAAFIERFNVRPIRGSSSRRGVAALLEMKRMLETGVDVAITPDGPRGPRYHLNPGVVTLAQKTGVQIMPINVEYSGYWQLKSWDGFMIPKPFSRAVITLAPLYSVEKTTGAETFEAERARLEQTLNTLRNVH